MQGGKKRKGKLRVKKVMEYAGRERIRVGGKGVEGRERVEG